jgi:predicted RNase H-like HicB family nuclease
MKKVDISVKKRNCDYIAYKTNEPTLWENGKTMEEAVGKLAISMHLVTNITYI